MKEQSLLWVVYKMTIRGHAEGMNAVCEQSEWDAMELAQPSKHKLIQAGITNEGEAERLARGTAGDAIKRRTAQEAAAEAVKPRPVDVRLLARREGEPVCPKVTVYGSCFPS